MSWIVYAGLSAVAAALTAATIPLFVAGAVFAQPGTGNWLDTPLSPWNTAGASIPAAPAGDESIAEIVTRCSHPTILRTTPGERALADAGWLPFHIFDKQIIQGDIEIVGALAAVDGMCRPMDFNAFVFVGGRLAGTLSPRLMGSREDGSIGALRLAGDGRIAAEFSRYTEKDPMCCPSSRVRVEYRLEKNAAGAVVVPVTMRPVR